MIPASSLEVLKTAVIFGADAVYIGGEAFGLRAKAKNFSMEDMKEGIAVCPRAWREGLCDRQYPGPQPEIFPACEAYFKELKEIGPDALIISDPGVFMIAKRVCPEIEIHISTQANNTNYGTYRFWHELGAKRVVSARELSMKEIKEIRSNIPGRSGDRDLRPRSHVHFLFRPLPSEQLFHRKGRQPGSLYPSLPLEICGDGGVETRRVSAGL